MLKRNAVKVNSFMDNQIYFWAHMLDEAFGANDTLLTEGDHWPEDYFRKLASKTNDEIAKKFVTAFDPRAFDGDATHRFSNTLISYFNKAVQWMLQSGISQEEFISGKLPGIVNFLKTLESDKAKEKELRAKIKVMPLQDFEQFMQEFTQQKADAETSKLAQQSFSGSKQYDVIRIASYEQMHELFGGSKTGDPKDPGSAWCHTNGDRTYDNWIDKGAGSNIFFVIASKDWQAQQYPDNPMNALDKYGSSLCAILVSTLGQLLNSTLRYNHKCEVEGRGADSAFADWADLNQFYGQDIRSEVFAQMKEEISKAEAEANALQARFNEILANATEINKNTIPGDIRKKITHIAVPNSITSIGDQTFAYCESLTNVIIPDSVTRIGEHAFYNCNSLTSITIPDSVANIEKCAFACCASLTSITIPDSVTSIGDYTFGRCTSLTHFMIPDSATSIGEYAFYFCQSLKSIMIPDSVTSIRECAFCACRSLTSITIPDSVTNIGNDAFFQCKSLEKIIVPDQQIANVVLKNNPKVKDKIVIKPLNESKTYSYKQIKEAITYWENVLNA